MTNLVLLSIQILQEFHDVAKTSVRLMDKWQLHKAQVLWLAATRCTMEHLLADVEDMDEGGCLCFGLCFCTVWCSISMYCSYSDMLEFEF